MGFKIPNSTNVHRSFKFVLGHFQTLSSQSILVIEPEKAILDREVGSFQEFSYWSYDFFHSVKSRFSAKEAMKCDWVLVDVVFDRMSISAIPLAMIRNGFSRDFASDFWTPCHGEDLDV